MITNEIREDIREAIANAWRWSLNWWNEEKDELVALANLAHSLIQESQSGTALSADEYLIIYEYIETTRELLEID